MRGKAILGWLAAGLVIGACASTTSTGSLPVEALVVLDQVDRNLVLVPVDSPSVVRFISVADEANNVPSTLAVRGQYALVGMQQSGVVLVVDLAAGQVVLRMSISVSGITAVAFGDDGAAYAASANGVVTRFDPATGGGAIGTLTGGPQGFGVGRGKVYVVMGNRVECPGGCAGKPSWLVSLSVVSRGDSIGLIGPGNAGPAVTGADGNIYVLSRGDGGAAEGRLSVIDPVRNVEIASFGGFGPAPAWLGTNAGDRVLVASEQGGLMMFNIRDRRVERGIGSGIPLSRPGGIATDELGRVYILEKGACTAADPGRVRVFGPDLVERQPITGGICPIGAATTTAIPASVFGFEF